MRRTLGTVSVAALLLALPTNLRAAKTLDIYFIDVEGGQSTLVVTPAGQALLVDAGFAGAGDRDPNRILAAARDAHVDRIDFLLITHFHVDHDGGVPALADRIPIGTFIDYGEPKQTSRGVTVPFAAYAAARSKGKHLVPRPGDRLPLRGVDVDVVSAGGALITKPLAGAGGPNPACAAYDPIAESETENPRSIGFRLTYGAFRFVDLGDLDWNKLGDLACPTNLIGEADVYLVAHHANADSNVAAMLSALHPRIAITNNGVKKGGAPAAFSVLRGFPGLEDVWQLHRSENEGAANAPDARIANLDEGQTGYWLKLAAAADGSFTVTNGRTAETTSYPAKPPRAHGRRR